LIKENQEARQAKASIVATIPSVIDVEIDSNSSKSTPTQVLMDRINGTETEKDDSNKVTEEINTDSSESISEDEEIEDNIKESESKTY
jgi:hypothetical protein